MERLRMPKIDRIAVNLFMEVKRSKVKVIWPINAVTESLSYLPNGKAYALQT